MKFKIEDVQITTGSYNTVKSISYTPLDKGEWVRCIHKPTNIKLEHRSDNGIRHATKERLIAELKVLVENYEIQKS